VIVGISIVGPPSAGYATVRSNASVVGRPSLWYYKALTALWSAGLKTGVDPVVLAGQCAYETAWGNFGGVINADWGNTCGLKNRNATGDKPEDHAQFASDSDGAPVIGALAHAQHLLAYVGFRPEPPIVDPRFPLVFAPKPSALTVEDLGGQWAPARDYGQKVATVIRKLRGE
jgi:hypothetical protein